MAGVRVIEVAAWVAAPAAGMILADWGAEVIKVEPFNGDPARGMVTLGPLGINPAFEFDNRGKRSIALDVSSPDGLAVLHQLVAEADVFITNLRPSTLESLEIDPDVMLERYPALVYANVTGFGHTSEYRDRPSYDIGGFWARSGGAASHTVEGMAPPTLRGGYGDHMTAMTLAGGIAAALFERQTNGRGRHVTTSLARVGTYAVGQDFTVKRRADVTFPMGQPREVASNPMLNSYQAADGRWFWLLGLQPDRHWPTLLAAIDRPDLAVDERFASLPDRRLHSRELIVELDAVFASRDRDEWEAMFVEHGVWYEPVLSIGEALDDPIIRSTGAFIDVAGPDGPIPGVASPVDFAGSAIPCVQPVPDHGQHTDEILLELGHDWDTIIDWKISGAVM
ncbi:MAG: putative CoA-transferase [Ilumatobacteraceae bacterium]|nr:putative CoA-transferase [Ilumatobacteraceae bacterium]